MNVFLKKRLLVWGIAIAVAIILFFCQGIFNQSSTPKTTVTVYAPDSIKDAFSKSFSETKLKKNYTLEFTDDSENANLVLSEGISNGDEGTIFVYSPFVAIFNSDNDLYHSLIEDGTFVESAISSNYYDLDFKSIIDQVIEGSSTWKIYYPGSNSDYWDEFYTFLLYTVNDGYYPKTSEFEEVQEKVNEFLNSKNAEEYNISALGSISAIAKNAIYFMPYADFCMSNLNSSSRARIMYPETVVYHHYYFTEYDDLGKAVLDGFAEDTFHYDEVGYCKMRYCYYDSLYYSAYITRNTAGARSNYNSIGFYNSNATNYYKQ